MFHPFSKKMTKSPTQNDVQTRGHGRTANSRRVSTAVVHVKFPATFPLPPSWFPPGRFGVSTVVVVGSTWHLTNGSHRFKVLFFCLETLTVVGENWIYIKKQTFVSISLYGNTDVEEDAEGGRRRRRKKK